MYKLLLILNKYFKQRPHPFNMGDGLTELNYHDFEYTSAANIFDLFETKLGKQFWQGKSICDFACGAGGKSLWLLENGASHVIGLDMSKTLIEQAKKKCGRQKNIEFYVENVAKNSIKDESIDIVIANDIMEHVQDPLQTLREAYRILKPGGIMCINFEPYYHFLGHHMWDVINIPWAHVFFSEKTRIRAYKELVKNLPDAKERITFRIDTDKHNREYIGYLNHITIARYLKILKKTSFQKEYFEIQCFEKFPLNIAGKIPIIQEAFCLRTITILKKQKTRN